MGEEKSAPVDPHQLLKALSPLLGPEGEIKGAAEMDRVMSLMKDARKLVSRCVYMNILKATKNEEVLERCLGRGGWEMMYTWLKDAKEDNNTPFIIEMLHVYHNIPVTVDILKKNNTPKTIKSLSKSENEDIKTLAKNIVDKWMETISRPSSTSSGMCKNVLSLLCLCTGRFLLYVCIVTLCLQQAFNPLVRKHLCRRKCFWAQVYSVSAVNIGLPLQILGQEALPRQVDPTRYMCLERALTVLAESAKKTVTK